MSAEDGARREAERRYPNSPKWIDGFVAGAAWQAAQPVVVSAWRYDQAVEDVTVGSIADDAGYDPGEVVDHVISALGIAVTEDAP